MGRRSAADRHPAEVPGALHWDLWLGPAPSRPVPPDLPARQLAALVGFRQRDAGRHGLPLHGPAVLGARPPPPDHRRGSPAPAAPRDDPPASTVRYEFPASASALRPVRPDLVRRPEAARSGRKARHAEGLPQRRPVRRRQPGRSWPTTITTSFFPEDQFRDFAPPCPDHPAKSVGHHAEWIAACKDGRPTTCNFDYSGALTEAVLLGNVAYRDRARKIDWDAANLKATNCPAADASSTASIARAGRSDRTWFSHILG